MDIKIEITPSGGVRMLHHDAVDLTRLGAVEVSRASHVEFSNALQRWIVVSAATLQVLRDDFPTREDALAWEKSYYSPDGEGWTELTQGESF